MSDNSWRRKGYYSPRIIMDVADVLSSPFGDAVVCITGAQRNMLQNVMAYLSRRVTFASERFEQHYLTPTPEEWDDIQAIVADLEDKVMNCDAFTQMLEDILAAAACACAGSGKGYTDDVTGPIYDNLEDDGKVEWVMQDPTTVPIADDRCALAQLVWAVNYKLLTEYIQPLQTAAHNILLFFVLEALALMLGGPVGLVPGAALYTAIQAALDAWVEGELESVETALVTNKQDLVCAMYDAWVDGGDYGDAAAAAAVVIDSVEAWTDIDKALFKLTFAPWVMEHAQKCYDAVSEWSLDNFTPGYCAVCIPIPGSYLWTFPPCPGAGWSYGGEWADCSGSVPHMVNAVAWFKGPVIDHPEGTYWLAIRYKGTSECPNGWGVGTMYIDRSVNEGVDWAVWKQHQITSLGDGVPLEITSTYSELTIGAAHRFRYRITGAGGSVACWQLVMSEAEIFFAAEAP